nr:MAG TPA: hypothetical protein [Caudoviricetes sp.]
MRRFYAEIKISLLEVYLTGFINLYTLIYESY